ncbi:MAG: cellulose synthase family protein, partial [Bacteroidota bacterium]
ANLLWLALGYVKTDRLLTGPVPRRPGSDGPGPGYDWPYVTVQLPLYNEQYVVDRVIDACARLDYPKTKLEIQVLDDSTDETVDIVARRVEHWRRRGLNIVHVRRTNRQGYKAGALQNGVLMASGELLAVFDADFIPPADFLRRVAPHFASDDVGMVQTRWGHLNGKDSLLTQIQAASLDAHFAIEQYVRNRTGCFMNFNGTAGVWRRACILDAGGWEGDTLTEDLDLSYRAQLRGWQFRFLPDIEVPAELPPDINALRAQQFRWTKGAAETSIKVLKRLWRSKEPMRVKLEGTMHLTNCIVFPFVLLVAAFHAPLLYLKNLTDDGPGDIYFAVLGLGILAFAGVFLVQLFAQRSLHPDWAWRMRIFPLFMAGSMGFAINNTRAVFEALIGKRTAFVRTPKFAGQGKSKPGKGPWWKSKYAHVGLPPVVWLECLMAVYCFLGLGLAVYVGEWLAVPFQALFAAGFGLVALFNVRQVFEARREAIAMAGAV